MTPKDILLLPNLITLTRLFVSIYLFFQQSINDFQTPILVLIIALIGLSDSLDGIVARRFNLVSRLGTILDPVRVLRVRSNEYVSREDKVVF